MGDAGLPANDQVTSDEELFLILEELLARVRAGEAVNLDEAVARHPQHAAELKDLWGTFQLAEDLAGAPPPEPNAPPVADWSQKTCIAGDYILEQELGRGGMGIVFQARQISLNRTVAIKMILRGEFASEIELSRFRGEAESAARLDHPNIVSIYDVGMHEGQPFFSMQAVPGTTLARELASGPMEARHAASLLLPVCRAIAFAHRQGVLHRDLKPSNILISREGRPLVTDFGLAKRMAPEPEPDSDPSGEATWISRSVTRTGDLVGTPGYMAPEQAAGNRGSVSAATDVYALGAILYAMLTGRAPFQSASPVDTLLMVLEQDPPVPRVLNAAADPDLELIALKALQKPPDLRYASADALADDLHAFLNHEPLAARSSHLSQILSRAFRPTHHVAVLENWGLLWMWHALVLLVLCLVTNAMQWSGVTSRWPYAGLWSIGLGTWAVIFWNLRRRGGPVTLVERQVAHLWAASMAASTILFGVEWLLDLPVLKLSPVLALVAGAVFVGKAGLLSGEFYWQAGLLYLTVIPMCLWPSIGITIFGVVSALTFVIPGWKFDRQKRATRRLRSG